MKNKMEKMMASHNFSGKNRKISISGTELQLEFPPDEL